MDQVRKKRSCHRYEETLSNTRSTGGEYRIFREEIDKENLSDAVIKLTEREETYENSGYDPDLLKDRMKITAQAQEIAAGVVIRDNEKEDTSIKMTGR